MKLSALIIFASDRYGTDEEPLIKTNPVTRLSRNRSWHRIYARQGIVPDHKLKIWYRSLSTLQHDVARDFFVFLLLTGMRFGETRNLKWCHVDFENQILIVPRELTKSDREHRLPLTDYLLQVLRKRSAYKKQSDWIFQSSRLRTKPISSGAGILQKVRAKSGIRFTFHDLRRTFLTMGEKLDVPTYALKRLVNHSVSTDMTGRYLILDIERLRLHMSRITEKFIKLLGISENNHVDSSVDRAVDPQEVIQLQLELKKRVHFVVQKKRRHTGYKTRHSFACSCCRWQSFILKDLI